MNKYIYIFLILLISSCSHPSSLPALKKYYEPNVDIENSYIGKDYGDNVVIATLSFQDVLEHKEITVNCNAGLSPLTYEAIVEFIIPKEYLSDPSKDIIGKIFINKGSLIRLEIFGDVYIYEDGVLKRSGMNGLQDMNQNEIDIKEHALKQKDIILSTDFSSNANGAEINRYLDSCIILPEGTQSAFEGEAAGIPE